MAVLPANFSKTDDDFKVLQKHAKAMLAIDLVVFLPTLLGNGVFIFVLAKKRSLHIPSNMLLGALAVSDLLVGIIAQPLWICELILIISDGYGSGLFTVSFIARWAFVFFSFVYIIIVGLDRYIAICRPNFYYAKATCKSHIIIASSAFIFSFIVYGLGQFIHYQVNTYIPVHIFTALVGLSLLITGYCNFKVFGVVKRQRKQIRGISVPANAVQQDSESGKGIYKTMIIPIITVLLFICYTPMIIMEIRWGTIDESKVPVLHEYVGQYWTEFLIYLNSLINPIVYYARMKAFRDATGAVLCPRRAVSGAA